MLDMYRRVDSPADPSSQQGSRPNRVYLRLYLHLHRHLARSLVSQALGGLLVLPASLLELPWWRRGSADHGRRSCKKFASGLGWG